VALGVGVLGVGTGVYFSVAHQSTVDGAPRLTSTLGGVCADQPSASCRARDDKLATARTQEGVSDVAFAVGVGVLIVGAAATTTALLWPRTRLTPAVSSTAVGATFSQLF
jgi:hypothetical protein